MKIEEAAVVAPSESDLFAGGYFAGKIVIEGKQYAIVVAPKAEGEHDDVKWNKTLKAVAGAGSYFDGLVNTKAMAEAGSVLAKWALGLNIGGFTDWYLPSRDELELLYRAFKPSMRDNYCGYRSGENPSSVPVGYPYTEKMPAQTGNEAFRAGGSEAFEESWYWSSSQSASDDGYAWYQHFSNGTQTNNLTYDKLRARAVRRVPV